MSIFARRTWMTGLLIGAIVSAGCTAPDHRRTRKPRRMLLTDFRPSSVLYRYQGRNRSPREYESLKRDELKQFRRNLKFMYRPAFRFTHHAYFNIAYRCTEREIKALKRSIRIFYEDVYPRYFRYEPAVPIRIIVFRNRREFIRHTNTRVYGSYIPAINTMITYYGSGSGTLWHELIHAFIKLNTDARPPEWFDEGLASFHEKARIRGGKFTAGFTNWRLRRLQAALDAGPIPSIESLVRSQSLAGQKAALSRARFLFCYLWYRGKMREFTRIYLYDLLPRYSGEDLANRTVKTLEELLDRPIAEIDADYLKLARRLRPNQEIPRRPSANNTKSALPGAGPGSKLVHGLEKKDREKKRRAHSRAGRFPETLSPAHSGPDQSHAGSRQKVGTGTGGIRLSRLAAHRL